jgi:cytidine deaminase
MAKISSMPASRSKILSKELVRAVKQSVKTAYAPYSKIRVSAGVLCKDGRIYTGANIENSSYSLTMCAERIALFKALSEGERKFQVLLVYSPQIDFILPCGACLQVISEFAPNIMVVTMNKTAEFRFHPLKTLLTKPFIT